MAQDIDSKQLRVLEISLVADVSANTFDVASVTYRRDGIGGTGFTVAAAQIAAANPCRIVFSEAIPQDVSVIVLTGTIQA
jgi:hypothetical protein